MALATEVVIIGAGPAGVAAAATLARAGVAVVVIEGGRHPGAENWSGAVYFCENLVADDCFGADLLAHAPVERPLFRRGLLITDGIGLAGLAPEGAHLFPHCVTVQRPLFDRFLAERAEGLGATLLAGCHATALLRERGRVIGVMTDQGAVYGSVVFLAEGDASHLVSREGYEEVERPHFAQGVKAVLKLSAAEIEARFHLAPNQGAAYEILLRNPILGGRTARLNAGCFLYTNRDSLALGYVLPLEAASEQWRGNHHQLLEHLRALPALAPWLAGAELAGFGAKLIRIGGAKESPRLVDNGLAIGGAATGIGVDFPCPNFTGPATFMGLTFARAVVAARAAGEELDTPTLTRRYAEPVRSSVYGRDARWLSRWPGFIAANHTFFATPLDWTLRAGALLADRDQPLRRRLWGLGRCFEELAPPRQMARVVGALAGASRALHLGRGLLHGLAWRHPWRWLSNCLGGGDDAIPGQVVYLPGGVDTPPPAAGARHGRRLAGAMAALARLYTNDQEPLEGKLPAAAATLFDHLSLLDLLVLAVAPLAAWGVAVARLLSDGVRYQLLHVDLATLWGDPASRLKQAREHALTVDPATAPEQTSWAEKMATLDHDPTTAPMRLFWPEPGNLEAGERFLDARVWRVCPVRVYEREATWVGQPRVAVSFENCLKCESCWRADGFADWSRTRHHVTYPILGEVAQRWATTRPTPPPRPLHPPRLDPRPAPPWLDTLGDGVRPAVRDHLLAVARACTAYHRALEQSPRVVDGPALAALRAAVERVAAAWEVVERPLSHTEAGPWLAAGRDWIALAAHHLDGHHLFWAETDLTCLRDHHLAPALAALPGAPQRPPRPASPFPPDLDPPPPVAVLRAGLDLATRKALEAGELVAGQWVARHAEALAAATPVAGVHTLAALEPGLAWAITAHHLAVALWGDAPPAWPAGSWLTVAGEAQTRLSRDGETATLAGEWRGVATALATWVVVATEEGAACFPLAEATVEPTTTVGVRAARLCCVRLSVRELAAERQSHDRNGAARRAAGRCAAIACAFAAGFGGYLTGRARAYAASRVQFGDTFRDRQGRTGVDKFGAVKGLIADCDARLAALTALARGLTEEALDPAAPFAYAVESLTPNHGAFAYNAGQVFGGTAYSEDDFLAKYYRDATTLRLLWEGVRPPLEATPPALVAELDDPLFAACRTRWDSLASRVHAFLANAPGDAAALLAGYVVAAAALLDDWRRHLSGGGGGFHREAVEYHLRAGAAALAALRDESPDFTGAAALLRAPFAPVEAVAPYSAVMERAATYASGDFLTRPAGDLPLLTPEAVWRDETRRDRWQAIHTALSDFLSHHPGDYARTLDANHHLPDADVAWFAARNWYATLVPEELGGLGWKKADYALLNWQVMTEVDPSVSLLIMANTSIGTTPVLLGLERELVAAAAELTEAVRDPARLAEIGERLTLLLDGLAHPEPARLTRDTAALVERVDAHLRHTRVLKYLAGDFLLAFYGAAQAGKRRDLAGFAAGLKQAHALLPPLAGRIAAALAEIDLQRAAHLRYLRGLACGRVAAFALTEPTAGSDSGGVTTHATPVEVPVHEEDDGRLWFEIDGARRNLADASRLRFVGPKVFYDYRPGATAELVLTHPADIGPATPRRYDHDTTIVELFDCAAVRRRPDGAAFVRFFEVTGAKMWITNGRVAHQMALYCKTDAGVSGLMVDRFAENLVVGSDEHKLGQCASPTNELSLNRVRVPAENLIGFAGHGQVNALETLNAGRMGLAVAAAAMTAHLSRWLAGYLAGHPAAHTPAAARCLDRLAAEAIASESVAFFCMGLFDHPGVESARMESAVAKFFCSESLHRAIDLAERALGVASATTDWPVEKMRRDARVLNIYEGTNEVQRFLILKELTQLVRDHRLGAVALPEGGGWGRWGADRAALGAALTRASGAVGEAVWNDGDFQPWAFVAVEMAANLLLRYSLLQRRNQCVGAGGESAFSGLLEAMEEEQHRAFVRLQHRFEEEERWCADHTLPLATCLFEEATAAAALSPPYGASRPLSVVVVAESLPHLGPRPTAHGDALLLPDWELDPRIADALAQIECWRDQGVAVQTLALSAGDEQAVRAALAAGCEDATVVETPSPAADGVWATALAETLVSLPTPPDLIVVAEVGGATATPHRAPLLAGALARRGRPWPYLESVTAGGPRCAGDATVWRWARSDAFTGAPAATPLILGWGGSGRRPRVSVSARGRAWQATPRRVEVAAKTAPVSVTYRRPATPATASGAIARTPEQAAALLRTYGAAWGAASQAPVVALTGAPSDATPPAFTDLPWVVAAESSALPLEEGAIGRGAAAARACFGAPLAALYLTDLTGEPLARRLTTWQQAGVGQVVVLTAPAGPWPAPQLATWLGPILDPPHLLGGRWLIERSIGAAAAYLGGLAPAAAGLLLGGHCTGAGVVRELSAGRLEALIAGATPPLVCLDAPSDGVVADSFIWWQRRLPPGGRREGWWGELTPRPVDRSLLTEAPVILDVGYGVGDAAGMARVVPPLQEALAKVGLGPVAIGATRKVTQDLKLLPVAQQIGQTGVAVRPKLLFALGISGAPQHMFWIDPAATILAFNRDPGAPILHWNETHPGPLVHPIEGDLFETVERFCAALAATPDEGAPRDAQMQTDG